jgi:hypothetical protein
VTGKLETQPYVRVVALDFSKAFDSLRQSTLFSKLAALTIPDNIYNWMTDFLSDRTHTTKFDGQESGPLSITASVVQGSAIGPVAYAVAASDLRAQTAGNSLNKFADDTYLIIPAVNIDSTALELDHIEQWAEKNNLKLNRKKTQEIIIRKPRTKLPALPAPVPGVERVGSLKILGVTVSDTLSVTEHVESILKSSSQSFHALRTLRAHGLADPLIHTVFNARIMSKLVYCSPAWRGFASTEDMARMDAFVRKAQKFNMCSQAVQPVGVVFDNADDKLFKSIVADKQHVLHRLLPPQAQHTYNLRARAHSFVLPNKTASFAKCNFLNRILYKDCY